VMALTRNGHGGFAERVVAREKEAQAVPLGLDYVHAAAFYSSYGTAYHALTQRGKLRADETLVVLGAAGAVGLAAIEIARHIGARVIAVASSQRKLDAAMRHGADAVIDYTAEDLDASLRGLIDPERGVDVCLDLVGGDAFDVLSRRMGYGGRLLVVGFASGRIPKLPTNLTLLKGYSLVGVWWNEFLKRQPGESQANQLALAQMLNDRVLAPEVAETFSLDRTVTALQAILGRDVIGKLVVTVE
jgi:NADPH2:quinone reductase